MPRNIWLLFAIVSSCQASISYKWVSKTLSGEPCMSTCVNGKCFVDQNLNPAPCTFDRLAEVPEHPTARRRGVIAHCRSNCGKWGGHNYMWCYTTETYDWDYCNDEIETPGVNPGRDIYGRRCVDDCSRYPSSNNSEAKCHLESKEYVTCTHAGYVPVQSRSAILRQKKRSRRALDKIFSDTLCSSTCRGRYRDGRDGETLAMANAVYTTYRNVNKITTFPTGSPYRFVATTSMLNAGNQQVLMPLIIEAYITNVVYRPRGDGEVTRDGVENVNRMYNVRDSSARQGIQVGHLLAYSNGGTTDLFNYVGQTATLNVGPYKVMENEINSWLRLGSVDFKVVVVYDGTRPKEFYVKLKFYNQDGSLHSDLLDMVFLNN